MPRQLNEQNPMIAQPTTRWTLLRTITGIAGFALGLWLLVNLIRSNDFSNAPAILWNIGFWSILFILIPYSLASMLDAEAWRRMLSTGARIPFRKIFRIRTGSEALVITVPLGSILSDPFKGWMLKREFALPYSTTAASIVFRKALLGLSQGLIAVFIALVALCLPSQFESAALGKTVVWSLFFIGVGIAVVYGLLIALISYGSFVDRLHGWLARLPLKRIAVWFERKEPQFRECNAHLASFRGWRPIFSAIATYVLLWSIEDLETIVIVLILGANLTIPQTLVMEAACVLVRTAAPMVPGGIGIQDTGYVSMLVANGNSPSLAAAFLVLKRFRELVWAGLGYFLIAVSKQKKRSAEFDREEELAHTENSTVPVTENL